MTHNGFANYETWNVALWIQNEEYLYQLARGCEDYMEFVDLMHMSEQFVTPDDVSWTSSELDHDALNKLVEEL